jgi:hypothetical protein
MLSLANIVTALVFSAFLARHVLSQILAWFPGEEMLWRLSLGFGYDLLPALSILRADLGLGPWSGLLVLSSLAAMPLLAWRTSNLLLASIGAHIALLAIGACWVFSALSHQGASFSGEVPVFGFDVATLATVPPLLTLSAVVSALTCLSLHAQYIFAVLHRLARAR